MAKTHRPTLIRTGGNHAGRVEFDSRGNSVWRWRHQPEIDGTSHLLRQLDNAELELEPTRSVPIPKQFRNSVPPARKRVSTQRREREASGPFRIVDGESDPGGGFDPYNSSR
jgi:hypothetical protein